MTGIGTPQQLYMAAASADNAPILLSLPAQQLAQDVTSLHTFGCVCLYRAHDTDWP